MSKKKESALETSPALKAAEQKRKQAVIEAINRTGIVSKLINQKQGKTVKANKITLTVTVEALSIDSTPTMLHRVADQIKTECIAGTLTMDDGDTVSWHTKSEPVTL